MDKRSIIGLALVGVILFGFSWYNSNQSKKYAEQKRIADSTAVAEGRLAAPTADTLSPGMEEGGGTLPEIAAAEVNPAQQDSVRRSRIGDFLFEAADGQEEAYTVENDVMEVTFSNRGGRITGIRLKNYQTYHGDPLLLYADGTAHFDLTFFIRNRYNDIPVKTGDFFFTCDNPLKATVQEGGPHHFAMKLAVDSTSYVEYLYTIQKDDYMIDFDVRFVNMEKHISQKNMLNFTWGSVAPQQERGFQNENKYSTIAYKFSGADGIEDIGISEDTKEATAKGSLHWIAFKQQFFSSVFIAKNNFQNAELRFTTFPDQDNIEDMAPADRMLKKFDAEANVTFSKDKTEYSFAFYTGPNRYLQLKSYDIGLERLVPLGWSIVRWVNTLLVIPVFNLLSDHIGNFGLIILLLTIMIKIIILPLTYKSYLSMGKMRLLKPDIDAIGAKYPRKEDAMKKQQATMELYKRAGVSPMGGCIPMLIQFPVIVALFYFFPSAIELRQESFLWATDLSTYDSVLKLPFSIPWYGAHISLFTLLMAVSLFLSTKFNPQTAQSSQIGGMKYLTYMMPVMLLIWFNNFASGLTYYYLLSNVMTIGQTWGFKYIVNDEKLKKRMHENASKKGAKSGAKKKSKWQQRYEDMVKAQQQQAQQKKRK